MNGVISKPCRLLPPAAWSATPEQGFRRVLRLSAPSQALIIDAGANAVGAYVQASLAGELAVLSILNSAFTLVIAFLLFAMIFKVLPAVRLAWRDVWIGALVTGLSFTLGKFLIGYYVGRSGIASSYGAAASLITILLWIYYSSLILLFGAEFTKAYAETKEVARNRHSDRGRTTDVDTCEDASEEICLSGEATRYPSRLEQTQPVLPIRDLARICMFGGGDTCPMPALASGHGGPAACAALK